MYLDRVQQAFEEFNEVEQAATAVWKETERKLHEEYNMNGNLFHEKYKAGKEMYDTTIEGARAKGLAIVKEEFLKVNEVVREFITLAVPDDFVSTLEAIKATGKEITEAEADAYLDKYKNNYTAYLSLSKCLQEQTGRRYYVARYDAIKRDIAEQEKYAETFFQNDTTGYIRTLFATRDKSPLMKFDEALQGFIKSDVGGYESSDATE